MSDNTNSFFSFLEVDAPKTVVTTAATATERIECEVSTEGAERAQADATALRNAGMIVDDNKLIYKLGTRVNEAGVRNGNQSRAEYEALPLTVDAMNNLAATVRAEQRRDYETTSTSLLVSADGKIGGFNGESVPLTRRAAKSLVSRITDNASAYLPEMLTRNDAARTHAAALLQTHLSEASLRFQMRTRNNPTGRECFAVVGPRYVSHDIDKVAAQVAAECPPDSRCEVKYDGYKMQADIIFHSNVDPSQFVTGEIFKTGIRVKAADDGTGSISTSLLFFRNLCRNLIILDKGELVAERRRHMGQHIHDDVQSMMETAHDKMGYFIAKWNDASLDNIVERFGAHDAEEIFRRMVWNRLIVVEGLKKETLHERLMTAWATEPGNTKANILNAITKAAHSHSWNTSLEEQAGALLMQQSWTLPPLEIA